MNKKSAFIAVVIKPRKMVLGMMFSSINAIVANVSFKGGDRRRNLTEAEITILRRFVSPDYPFSLMFRLLLKKLNLL